MNYTFTFTVFTATYNRANTLHRVYESLRAQTFRDFEWLVVDNGSVDHTAALIHAWQQEANFPIHYIWQHNQSKHMAFRRGVQEAMGELFLAFDADDVCVPDALERFYYYWQNIPPGERSRFSAVTVLCKDQDGRLIGNAFPRHITDSDLLEIFYVYRVDGEKWGFHRTDVLKEFPFPEGADASFVPEGMVWTKIAQKFKTRFVNEILCTVYRDVSETTNQLTRPRSPGRYPKVWVLWHQTILNEQIRWFRYSPWTFFQSAVHYSRFSFHAGIGILNQSARLYFVPSLLWFLFFPVGFIVFLRDKSRLRANPSI
jgi:glycosyltransferase involved in cell wall biosynthesis